MRAKLRFAIVAVVLTTACNPASAPDSTQEFTTLQRGEATVRCRDGDDYPRRPIADITIVGLHNTLADCDLSELVLFYEGEIDPSFAQLMTLIADRQWPYDRRTLFLHSAGGDVEAAFQASEAVSRDPWNVFVARTGEVSLTNPHSTATCYSACIFLLAAARERVVQGQVGIHRMYPSGSAATSRQELAQELESITERAKAFMRLNGVSASIVDDMMSVSSSEIRILTPDELEAYGLGHVNTAQADLERLDLERRCGEDFVSRLQSARAQIDEVCAPQLRAACALGSEACAAANPAMDSCSNEANRAYGFPDPVCPSDGPYFYCSDGTISKNCEN